MPHVPGIFATEATGEFCIWGGVGVCVCTSAHMGLWRLPPPAKVLRITYQRHCKSWYIHDCLFFH